MNRKFYYNSHTIKIYKKIIYLFWVKIGPKTQQKTQESGFWFACKSKATFYPQNWRLALKSYQNPKHFKRSAKCTDTSLISDAQNTETNFIAIVDALKTLLQSQFFCFSEISYDYSHDCHFYDFCGSFQNRIVRAWHPNRGFTVSLADFNKICRSFRSNNIIRNVLFRIFKGFQFHVKSDNSWFTTA